MPSSQSRHILALAILLAVLPVIPGHTETTALRSPRRVIRSASELEYPPLALVRQDGTADGFSVALLKAVAGAVGLEVEFRVGPWHEIKQDLIEGRLDALPLVSYSTEREATFDFTASYLRMHGAIFIRRNETSIHSEKDLKDKEVLVMRDDTAHEYALRHHLTDKLILTDSFEEAMRRLAAGKHDAVIVQHLVGMQLIKELNIDNLVTVGSFQASSLKPITQPLYGFEQKFCIAVREGDKELLALLNEGLALVIANGVYGQLYNEWFAPILSRPPIDPFMILRYTLYALLPILLLVGFSGIWFLKREVARKTDIIKENEERFSIIFNKSPFPTSLSRLADGALVDVNEAWVEVFGFDRNEAIGKTPAELGITSNPEELVQLYATLGKKGALRQIDLAGFRTKDKLAPIIAADLEVIELAGERYVFAPMQDVTERRQAEAERLKISRQHQLALNAANMGWWYYDPITRMAYWDERYKEIFDVSGYSRPNDEILKRLHPEDLSRVWAKVEAALDPVDPQPYSAEYRINMPDGTQKWVEAHGLAAFEGTGPERQAVSLAGTVADITQRKRNAEELAASEKKYRELLETANSIIIRWDNRGIILFINEFGARFFGYRVEELTNQDVMTLVPAVEQSSGRDMDEFVKDIVLHPEQYAYVPNENLRKDGKIVWVTWTNKAMLDEQGNVMEILAIGNDITTLKETEAALRQSEERIRSSLAEKEVLLKEIHHRVKNNMQVISSLMNLQIDKIEDAAMRSIFQDVIHRVQSMAMVHEKLYQSDDLGRVEFADYTQSLLSYLWQAQGRESSGIRLDLDLTPVFMPVNMAVPCGLILNELISNALKHAFHGRKNGTVSVWLRKAPEGGVVIGVRDDGIGLPPEMNWLESRTLGLRLIRLLTRQLRAGVTVDADKGTAFTITLEVPKS